MSLHRMAILDPKLDKLTVNNIWKAMDPKSMGFVNLADIHDMLSSRFGKDKTSKPSSVLDKVKAKILERSSGTGGIKGLTK